MANDTAAAFDGASVRRYEELRPATEYHLDGLVFETLPAPGEHLCTFATVNDVHFGETVCGVIDGMDIGPTFRAADEPEPYADTMNRAAVAEIAALDPALVVAKGDLTAAGTTAEFEQFLDHYQRPFGDDLMFVRGNHDTAHDVVPVLPTQVRHLPGVTVALLDTSVPGRPNGDLTADQLEWLEDIAADADRPVLVMGHHNIWNPDVDRRDEDYFGIVPTASEALVECFRRHPTLKGYFAGHTHRNLRQVIGSVGEAPFTEVSCVKDFPGVWAEYRVFSDGILQICHRVAAPDALAWTEKTRHMYDGHYAAYAFGGLDDRCFLIEV